METKPTIPDEVDIAGVYPFTIKRYNMYSVVKYLLLKNTSLVSFG
jgi:hypothetical protein